MLCIILPRLPRLRNGRFHQLVADFLTDGMSSDPLGDVGF